MQHSFKPETLHQSRKANFSSTAKDRQRGRSGHRLMTMRALAAAFSLLACWLFFLRPALANSVVPDNLLGTNVGDKSKFDYFLFSQEWPGTYCEAKAACCQFLKDPVEFSIHGVWPEFNDGSWPECCDGPAFNMSKVEELADDLQKNWPTLYCKPPKQCNGKVTGNFWQHEWEKHGTCGFPTIPDEAAFFKIGLLLHQKFNLSEMLSKAGIVPHRRTKYKATTMSAAIQKATGFKPVLVCQSRQIKEVYICFNKNFELRHCDSSALAQALKVSKSGGFLKSSCNGYVLFPPLGRSSEVEVT